MEKFINWWKQEKRYIVLLKAALMALLPVLCCLVTCAAQGRSIGEVYLPGSEWNDELFYFKQVEGIVNYGYPQGYFGFNESHALKLSFAAWSPVLVFPWILWGLFFGWNLLSPVICNILLLTMAVFLFVWLVKPTWKQLGILTLLFCLYTPFTRYMLSGMPEVICFSMLIVFYGTAVSFLRRDTWGKLLWMLVVTSLLTLMRPYMLLFMLLPLYFWVRKSKWKGVLGSLAVVGVVGAGYALIKHYLGAEYFAPLFFTEWITTFFDEGIGAGIHNFFGTLYWMGKAFLSHTVQGFRSGLASGAFFGGYLVMTAVLLWQTGVDFVRMRAAGRNGEAAGKPKNGRTEPGKSEGNRRGKADDEKRESNHMLLVEAHLALCFVGMLFALLLMYKLTEGSKHLLTFMAVGIFVISLMKTRFYKKAVLVGAVFAYLYSYMAADPYDYQIPFVEGQEQAQVAQWQEALEAELSLAEKDTPKYDNVVIWVLNDTVAEKSRNTKWQLLYALPKGFGISCCEREFVTDNFESLQSRYIATLAQGSIDKMCAGYGYREIYRDLDMVLYERY